MAPPSDGGPSEAESQNRRIPPTPVCRDEVGLTSWLGKPLHLPARREQVWVLRLTLEFRMLPCIRGCRLTGLVTSRIGRCVGGEEPPGEGSEGKGTPRVFLRTVCSFRQLTKQWEGARKSRLRPKLRRTTCLGADL